MHGSSGLTGFRLVGLGSDKVQFNRFLVCLSCLGFACLMVSVLRFESGLQKKDLTRTENAVECTGSTGRIDCPRSLTTRIEIICVGMCNDLFLLEIVDTESTSIRKNRCSVVEPRLVTNLI